MATIGLYDIDLWHRGKSVPNLELMKIYNYYTQKDYSVKMMKPNDEEGRFTNIIYFKDNPNVQIPRVLNLNGDKKTIYGYGFYNSYTPLIPEIAKVPPLYDLYDPYSWKFKIPKSNYDELKRSSIIRIENSDFSGYKKEAIKMFFVDHNALHQENAYDILLNNKNNTFVFLHNIRIKDEETYYKFERFYPLISNYILIDFRYNSDFFFNVFKDRKIIFPTEKREDETILNFQLRKVKIGLFYKASGIRQLFPFIPTSLNNEDELINKWLTSNSTESFEKSYKIPNNIPSELRILLKQDPKKIGSSQLDFSKNL